MYVVDLKNKTKKNGSFQPRFFTYWIIKGNSSSLLSFPDGLIDKMQDRKLLFFFIQFFIFPGINVCVFSPDVDFFASWTFITNNYLIILGLFLNIFKDSICFLRHVETISWFIPYCRYPFKKIALIVLIIIKHIKIIQMEFSVAGSVNP